MKWKDSTSKGAFVNSVIARAIGWSGSVVSRVNSRKIHKPHCTGPRVHCLAKPGAACGSGSYAAPANGWIAAGRCCQWSEVRIAVHQTTGHEWRNREILSFEEGLWVWNYSNFIGK